MLRTIPGGILIATVIGVIDSLIVWAIAALFDVEILLPEEPGSEALTGITFAPILLVVTIVAVAAGILLWVLQRFFHERALRIFQIVAGIVLVLSLAVPFQLDQSLSAQLALVGMHLLVGSAIVATFTWVATKPAVAAGRFD